MREGRERGDSTVDLREHFGQARGLGSEKSHLILQLHRIGRGLHQEVDSPAAGRADQELQLLDLVVQWMVHSVPGIHGHPPTLHRSQARRANGIM